MFNKSKFNKNLFNKLESLQLSGMLYSEGLLDVNFLVFKRLEGEGIFTVFPTVIEEKAASIENNVGILTTHLVLKLYLTATLKGTSELSNTALGDSQFSMLHLQDLNLAPGESIIIDTDLLSILINEVEDVSSVSDDSEFFQLGSGHNEISVVWEFENPSTNQKDLETQLEITSIWQNRWL